MIDKSRTILALDLGTNCGWAVWLNGMVMFNTWHLKGPRYEADGMRYVRFTAHLEELRERAPMHRIVFEEVMNHKGTFAAHCYGGFLATMMAFAHAHSIPYRGVGVGTIKKHATGKGNATKDEMMEACANKLNIIPGDDNQADALWLLDYARKHEDVSRGT